jgi:hypothetical protein
MRRIFLLLTFNHSGSSLTHGEIKKEYDAHEQHFLLLIFSHFWIRPKAWRNKKREYVAHAQDFFPVDLHTPGIRPKAWRNKNLGMLRMLRIFLLLIFIHPGSGLKHGEIKM